MALFEAIFHFQDILLATMCDGGEEASWCGSQLCAMMINDDYCYYYQIKILKPKTISYIKIFFII